MISVLVAGDFCPQYRVQSLIDEGKVNEVLSHVKEVTQHADYSVVNFECPVVFNNATPITKNGPNLKTNLNGLNGVKYAGFNCVTLANNHFYDYGEIGVDNTLTALKELEIDFCGGGKDLSQASKIFYKKINQERIAIINCCEHEFSIAQYNKGGSNPLNPIQQFYAISEACKNADYVLVIVHGGHEGYQLPSPRMKEVYRFFIDAGADAVINHHQHCYSGYEIYNGKPIFYGLGNLLFDNNPIIINDIWNYGYMVELFLSSDKVDFKLHPYSQCDLNATVKMLEMHAFDDNLSKLNAMIAEDELLSKATNDFYSKTCQMCGWIIEPFFNRYYIAALKRGLIPSLISQKRKLCAENYVCCESHRDKLIYFFNQTLKQ